MCCNISAFIRQLSSGRWNKTSAILIFCQWWVTYREILWRQRGCTPPQHAHCSNALFCFVLLQIWAACFVFVVAGAGGILEVEMRCMICDPSDHHHDRYSACFGWFRMLHTTVVLLCMCCIGIAVCFMRCLFSPSLWTWLPECVMGTITCCLGWKPGLSWLVWVSVYMKRQRHVGCRGWLKRLGAANVFRQLVFGASRCFRGLCTLCFICHSMDTLSTVM